MLKFSKKMPIYRLQRKNIEKGVLEMTDGIGRIFGGNSYGVGGYAPQRREEAPQNAPAQQPAVQHHETQVDPSKVMEFMANNNIFITPQATSEVGELDSDTKDRVAGYMERFEMIYGIVQEEFGEENAPTVMDYVMDSRMGMTA